MDRRRALLQIAAGLVGGRLFTQPALASGSPAGGIGWLEDLETAHQHSQDTNRPTLVVFAARWCTFCKRMDGRTFADPQIVQMVNLSFVPVRLDFDAEQRIARVLEVRSLPCSVVLSPQADLLARIEGYIEPERYARALEAAQRLQSRVQHARFERVRRAP